MKKLLLSIFLLAGSVACCQKQPQDTLYPHHFTTLKTIEKKLYVLLPMDKHDPQYANVSGGIKPYFENEFKFLSSKTFKADSTSGKYPLMTGLFKKKLFYLNILYNQKLNIPVCKEISYIKSAQIFYDQEGVKHQFDSAFVDTLLGRISQSYEAKAFSNLRLKKPEINKIISDFKFSLDSLLNQCTSLIPTVILPVIPPVTPAYNDSLSDESKETKPSPSGHNSLAEHKTDVVLHTVIKPPPLANIRPVEIHSGFINKKGDLYTAFLTRNGCIINPGQTALLEITIVSAKDTSHVYGHLTYILTNKSTVCDDILHIPLTDPLRKDDPAIICIKYQDKPIDFAEINPQKKISND